ncbi:CPBP family intramembrane glutamic endopeptidase [Fodinicola feengrottensis]|uniref:CPBP family intramembrane glutamic endopeptidase n=1 Tax=Fodinicola feengrottensis TaxID=435914 RepID=UPI0013D3094F|nr:CPBP family intramembrane glutamic endopeptidase [Fodinicola feengrottensis]
MATKEIARPNRVVEKLLADRHSLPLSITLHLVPGALIVAVYFLVQPVVKALGCPSFVSWAIALCLVLGPVLLGLLWLGRQRNGRLSLRGVLKYLDKPVSGGKLVAIVAALIVWFVVVSTGLISLDNAVYQAFFTWLPFDGAGSATGYLHGYSRSTVIITLAVCLPLTGFSLPLIEELYFRGFLLPRLPQLGRWAPLVNTVLFSLYHFWSPWSFISRVIFFLPGPLLVWWKKDLRLSIGMHPGTTLVLTAGGLIALIFNLAPGLTS